VIAGNIPNRVDLAWFKRGGGMVGHDHPPAYRFNGGQKLIYWIVVLGGAAAAASAMSWCSLLRDDDRDDAERRDGPRHRRDAVVAAMLGHIYIGTIGMEGAFEAMSRGTVDLNWAKEHHSLWLEEESARARPERSGPAPDRGTRGIAAARFRLRSPARHRHPLRRAAPGGRAE